MHCGRAHPLGRPLYSFPSVIGLFLVSCCICLGLLHVVAGLSIWLSAFLAIPIVVAVFSATVRMASWSDRDDGH